MKIKNIKIEKELNKIFDNHILTEAKIIREKNVEIEIRTKENGHNIPHCHVKRDDKEASISLIDFKVLSTSNINKKQENEIINLVEKNKDELRRAWEEFHGISLLKDGKWEE